MHHNQRSAQLVACSALVWSGLLFLNLWMQNYLPQIWPWIVIAQGLWLYRLYAVAHEASHHKLFPDHPRLNDVLASMAMLWVWAPISIFRQIHNFHHGANRRAAGIATLDTMVVQGSGSRIHKWLHYAKWYLLVFACGFFLHTLASIVLFLVLPQKLGRRLSPAFIGWSFQKRAVAWLEFSGAMMVHGLITATLGAEGWFKLLGAPMIVFAWIWSAMLYIYHYRTTVGKRVHYNVRSLPHQPFFSWLLLNFNYHSIHHNDPRIPWYELPRHENPQPEDVKLKNQNVAYLGAAIWQQLKGPTLVVRSDDHVGRAS